MSKWIDADALKEKIDSMWNGRPLSSLGARILVTIDDAPSIDIVRCAECIWRDKDNQDEDYCIYAKGLCDINESSFCSWGERKESE